MRSHTDYGDVIYDQLSIESFLKKLELIQYKIALTITGAIQDISREYFLCCMFKIMKNQALEYLNVLIPKRKQNFNSFFILKF